MTYRVIAAKRVNRMLSRLVGVEITHIRHGDGEPKLILLTFCERNRRNIAFKARFSLRLLLDYVDIFAGQRQLTARQFSDELGLDVTSGSLPNCIIWRCSTDSEGNVTIQVGTKQFVMRATRGPPDAPATNWILHMNNSRIARGDGRFVRFRGEF